MPDQGFPASGPAARTDPRPAPLSRARRRVFAAVTVLLPLVGLLLVEGGLRVAEVGHSDPLFVSHPDAEGYVAANPTVIRRFLAGSESAPKLRIKPVPFRPAGAGRAPETFRIVVQGGSTAAGYPYGYGASLAAMLRQRLQRTYPERRIEVIPTAVAAVNSYTLLDFSGEILEQDPDAVAIYAGHNEYLGILGVGSTFSAGRHRPLVLAYLAFDDLRLLQLGRQLLARWRPPPEPRSRRTLMARVVAEERIPYGSELYHRGLAQYRANLEALLERYEEAGVPVYVGTLVSNERDQPPFIAAFGDDADTHTWRKSRAAGEHALWRGEPEDALESFDAAVAADRGHAEGHLWRARALEALGRYAEAREAYRAAKDRDQLRFRAPEAMNTALREVAAEHGGRVVDVRGAFARESPHGIVGRELMLEHLHPNVEGYFLLADAYFEAFRDDGLIGAVPAGAEAVSRERALREIPLNEVERLRGMYRVGKLTAGWPFEEQEEGYRLPRPEGPVERIAQGLYRGSITWSDAMQRLLDHHRSEGATGEAARVAALLADLEPHEPERQRTAARLLREAGRPDFRVYQGRADSQ